MFTSRVSVVRNLLGLSVLLSSLLVTACNNSDSGTINSDETGATTMAFSPPAVISQSRIASDDLKLEIFVDGTDVPLSRNDAGQWVGTTMVPSNSNVEVIVNWSEDLAVYVDGPLLLATATKDLNVAAGATSAQLTFLNSEFDTSIDTDQDGRSNLAERNDNFDPLDDDSPGVAINTVPVRISLELPASLSDAPEATKQVIAATASLNGQQVTLTREGDLWTADAFAAENSSVFVSATFYDSSQLGSRLAVVQRSQDIAGAATLLFFANDYSSTFDDDNDGLSNALEVTNGSNPKDSNSPAREPCDISQFTIGCTTDTDEDGKPDSQETAAADSDEDGIPNYLESTQVDDDRDGRSEEADADDDDPCVPTVNASACQATLAPTWVNGTIVISGETDTSLTASWSGARHGVGVTSYEIRYVGGGVTDTVVSTSASTVLTGLNPETTYTITVEARDAAGNQSTTGPDTTGTTEAAMDETAPTWTGGGSASVSGETETSMMVSWSGATDAVGVTSYQVTYTGGGVTDTVTSASTSIVLTGLEPETTYSITVEALDAAGNVSTTGPGTSGTTDEPAPVPDTIAPTWTGGGSASVSNETETSMMVSWSGATDAVGVTSYQVTYTGDGVTDTVTSASTSIVLTGLEPETTYSITVEALDAAGNVSTTGPGTSGTTDEPAPVPDTIAPTWTGGGSASVSNETETSMMVSWSGATDAVGVTSYEVTYTGGGATVTVQSTSTSTVLTGLESETTYTITVEALDAAGNASTTGPSTTGTTDDPAPVPDTIAPTWTGGGSASVTNETETSMMVSWSGATDAEGVTSYEVTYTGDGATDTMTSATTSTVLTGLEPETTYTITVEAIDAAGNESTTGPDTTGTTEAEIDATAPTWTGGGSASVSNETETTMRVSWSGATDDVGVTGYEVTYTGGGVTNTALSSTSSELLTGLEPETTYTITVEALDAAGNESTTGPDTTGTTEAAIDATAPTWTGAASATVNNETETSMRVRWSGATDDVGVTGYEVTYTGGGVTNTALSSTSSELLTGLDPDTDYSITVEAFDAAGNESTTGPSVVGTTEAAIDATAPTWTTGELIVNAITETSVTLAWSSASDAEGVTSYLITYDGVGSTGSAESTTTNITISTLTPDTDYTFTVEARDEAGNESTTGPSVMDTTDAVDPDPDETAPTWTAGIATLDSISETSATVSWSGATDDVGVVDYTLNYDDGDESTGTTFSTTLTATLQGLLPGTNYTFTVRARDAAGNSSAGDSPSVVGTTDETGA